MIASQTPFYREQGRAVPIPPALGSGLSWAIIALTFVSNGVFGVYVWMILKTQRAAEPADGHVYAYAQRAW